MDPKIQSQFCAKKWFCRADWSATIGLKASALFSPATYARFEQEVLKKYKLSSACFSHEEVLITWRRLVAVRHSSVDRNQITP